MISASPDSLCDRLRWFKRELKEELNRILSYWLNNTIDVESGGFYGRILNNDMPVPFAEKGLVLNARILWSFAAAYRNDSREEYLSVANRAYQYIVAHFLDKEYGGMYWSVDYKGRPLDKKKQIYALAFAIYALAEYYKVTQNKEVLSHAIALYNCIEKYSYDPFQKGYFEAFSESWEELTDLRLSEKDDNEKKTMNTHLHVLEAYANLYTVYPTIKLKQRIQELLAVFRDKIMSPEGFRMLLFFDEDWEYKSATISYGHDIEASWLLQEAAIVIKDNELTEEFRELAVKMATLAAEGLDDTGGMNYEYHSSSQMLVREKHWWVQAEAMVGFFNAWENSKDTSFLQYSLDTWNYVKKNLLTASGEWYWGINSQGEVMIEQDKVGFWKCPYHNTRACLELLRRIPG